MPDKPSWALNNPLTNGEAATPAQMGATASETTGASDYIGKPPRSNAEMIRATSLAVKPRRFSL